MDPQLLTKLSTGYLYSLEPGRSVREFILASFDPEVPIEGLGDILTHNPMMVQYLNRFLEIARGKSEEGPESEDAAIRKTLGILGRRFSRAFVSTVGIQRALKTGLPRSDKDELTLKPQEMVMRGMSLEGFFEDQRMAHVGHSFSGALFYDWVTAVLTGGGGSKGKVLTGGSIDFDSYWHEGFQLGQFAYGIARLLKDFKLDAYTVGAGVAIGVGKILMAQAFPDGAPAGEGKAAAANWNGFTERLKKIPARYWEGVTLLERATFAVCHEELASLAAAFFPLLAPIEKSLRYYREPYYLESIDKDQYILAMVLSIAAVLTRHRKVHPDGKGDLPLASYQRLWLAKKGIKDVHLIPLFRAVKD